MQATVAVLVAAALAAFAVWASSRSRRGPDPIDPEREERWLVRWLGRHPRFGATARSIDRQAAGGLMLVVALAIVLGSALIIGSLVDMVGHASGLAAWDEAVAEWGSRNATSWSTSVLDRLTDLGGTEHLAVAVTFVAAYDFVRHRNLNVALFLLVVLAGVVLINNGVKGLVDRERPPVVHLVGTSGSSFPSGHSAAAAATWFALALVIARDWSRTRPRGRGGCRRPDQRGRRCVPSAARRALAHRRGGGHGRGLGVVPAQRPRVRWSLPAAR